MKKVMNLDLFYNGGGAISKEISYHGDTLTDIALLIDKDNNDLLEYMRTKDKNGEECFCFGGFIFQKANIIAAQLSEPEL